jgi:hypothetical protein
VKSKVKWLLLIALLAGATSVLLFTGNKISDEDISPYRFAVKDTGRIQRIFLIDRIGNRIILTREATGWVLNETYPVRKNAIDNLLDVINRVELKFVPPNSALENITRDLAANGIKVVIYSGNTKIMKSYYVGGMTPDERGTYMIMENSESPAVVYIPGWEGGLRARYWMRPVDWRSRTVLGFSFEEIQEITVQYPGQPGESFHLTKNRGKITVKPLNTEANGQDNDLVGEAGEAYLMQFVNLGAEAILENQLLTDSLSRREPFSIISVHTHDGEEHVIQLFPQNRLDGGFQKSLERYYVLSSWGDLYLVQDRIFRKILRGYSYFTSHVNTTG